MDTSSTDRLLASYDFLLKNYNDNDFDNIPPFCPLAAVGATIRLMDMGMITRFYKGELIINVIDSARGTVDVYDHNRLDFELDLERMAG
jgi:hypothetical protein